jgi:hypothetical protein
LQVARPKDTVGNPYDLNKVIYYEGYNFTIHIIWTPFLVRAEEDYDTKRYKLYLDEADDKWLSKVHLFDYVLISAANWFATPAYFYERGQHLHPAAQLQQQHHQLLPSPDGVPDVAPGAQRRRLPRQGVRRWCSWTSRPRCGCGRTVTPAGMGIGHTRTGATTASTGAF